MNIIKFLKKAFEDERKTKALSNLNNVFNNLIDDKIFNLLDKNPNLKYYSFSYPEYKFVDVFNGILKFIVNKVIIEKIESYHQERLANLLQSNIGSDRFHHRKINKAPILQWKINYDENVFIPIDTFWLIQDDSLKYIIRLSLDYPKNAIIEIGISDIQILENIKKEIELNARENSIYKNKIISVSYSNEIKNEYGEIESPSNININFLQFKQIREDEIVLDDAIKEILKRNIFDYFDKAETLEHFKIPLNRGILFYGPPGTGKTHTCNYIFSQLKDVTYIVATGQNLSYIKSICNVARMLQPSIVLLEDVDLLFSSREINLYSSALGELMDQMDGFNPNDKVVFILTTNAIERLEKAIKDRPGRINQTILFDNPNKELRLRYMKSYLREYHIENLDLENIASKIEGVSQAFIKELIYRACIFCLESTNYDMALGIHLQEEHFNLALKELLKFDNKASFTILGYQNNIL